VATRLVLPGALLGSVIGILAADGRQLLPALVIGGVGAIGGSLLLLGGRRTLGLAALAVAVGLALGGWRGTAIALPNGPGSVAALVGQGELVLAGTVAEDPKPSGTSQQVVLTTLSVSRPGMAGGSVRGRLLVQLPRTTPLAVGDRVLLGAEVEAPEPFDDFDYPAFLARQGIGGIIRARDIQVIGSAGGLARAAAGVRDWLLAGLNDSVPEPEAALGGGILLGARAGIAPEVSSAFATAGLTHVVAISGWNIAIVAALMAGLTRPLETRRGGRWLAAILGSSVVAGYVLLTGASPSVVRAALMAGALLVARFGGSRAHAASALSAAAFVMLIAAPAVLWDVGFQLSALATAGLIGFAAPLEARLASWPGWLREPLALTLAAQLATLPVLLTTFGRLSLVAPLANVVVVPLVPLVMAACAIAAPIGALDAAFHVPILGDVATRVSGGCAWLLLGAMIGAGQAAAALPFASLPITAPAWLAIPWYGGLGFAWRRVHRDFEPESPPDTTPLRAVAPSQERKCLEALRGGTALIRRPWMAAPAMCLVLVATSAGTTPDGRLHLTMLDIGQGDAILVEGPSGRTLLIDGGPDPDLLLRRLGEQLPWWQRRIDVVLLTHPHQDHVGGLLAVLERYQVGLVIDPDRPYPNPTYARFLEEAHAETGARIVEARFGQVLDLGEGATMRILFPAPADVAAPLPDGDINNASAVGILRYGGFGALLTGDAKGPIEDLLGHRRLLQQIDVLKVGHHGSNASTTPAFLAVVHPTAALISAGVGNPYGHPHRETLEKLAAVSGLRTHRTDLEGSIEVISDGRQFRVISRLTDDGWRPVRTKSPPSGRGTPASIGLWLFPAVTKPIGSSRTSISPMGSWSTRGAWHASLPRRRASSRPQTKRLTRSSSRSPPCCTTSTSPRRGAAESHMAWSGHAG
jgi:competence protein ComEC